MSSSFPRRTALRGVAGAAFGLAVGGALAGCSGDAPDTAATSQGPGPSPRRHEVVLHDDARATRLDPAAEPTVAASRSLVARCTAVVVGASDDEAVAAAARTATDLGLPLLVDGPGLAAELDRLAVRTVVRVDPGTSGASATPSASPLPTAFGDREVVDASGDAAPEVEGLPAARTGGEVLVVVGPDTELPPRLGPLLDVARAGRVDLDDSDPRRSAQAARLRGAPDALVVGVGALGEHFPQRVRTVRHAPEVPGGGWLPFPGRRMVALYGHPRTAALGMLGEQGPSASVRRARDLAARYADLTGDEVVPAFELIATVASGSAGSDGTYSGRTAVGVLEPWVATAEESGVYVVLDLQPGRADFLDQAKRYESLLRRPHVGLALDPEWRLGPDEKPLQQIGHVGIEEVNRVGRWLAELVREHDLPPKVLTLHQFRTSMIRGREDLDTSLDEVQWLVHADGQGTQEQKQGTWAALRRDLPDGVFLGWKNFEDEDHPMLTPAQTVERVHPTPSFVSYQ